MSTFITFIQITEIPSQPPQLIFEPTINKMEQDQSRYLQRNVSHQFTSYNDT